MREGGLILSRADFVKGNEPNEKRRRSYCSLQFYNSTRLKTKTEKEGLI